MNSLPFISHHLFVAAIASEGRVTERPARRERPLAGPIEQVNEIPLVVMDSRKPIPEGAARLSRARIAPVQT